MFYRELPWHMLNSTGKIPKNCSYIYSCVEKWFEKEIVSQNFLNAASWEAVIGARWSQWPTKSKYTRYNNIKWNPSLNDTAHYQIDAQIEYEWKNSTLAWNLTITQRKLQTFVYSMLRSSWVETTEKSCVIRPIWHKFRAKKHYNEVPPSQLYITRLAYQLH